MDNIIFGTYWSRPNDKTACRRHIKRKYRFSYNKKCKQFKYIFYTGFPIIKNVFKLFYLENHGAAFGLFQNQRFPLLIVTIIVLLAIGFVFNRIPHEKKFTSMRWILVVLAAGAVGNMIDRIANGYVVDFFYFELINFPVFNVADCYVVISAVLAVLLIIFYYDDNDLDRILKK